MSIGFPDGQRITQWLGAPFVTETALAIGAGSVTRGPFKASSWASVVLAVKPTGGTITATIRQALSGGPASLVLDTVVVVNAGVVEFESVVLFGDAVSLILQGSLAGETVDYALFPANTTTNALAVGGDVSGKTGDVVWSVAASRSDAVLADGSFYDGTDPTYAPLWVALGSVAPQNAFQVPDLRDRVPVGAGGNTALLANDGVAAANRHATRHQHPVTDPQHSHGGATGGSATAPGAEVNTGGAGNLISDGPGNTFPHVHSIPAGATGITVGAATDPSGGPGYVGLNPFLLL